MPRLYHSAAVLLPDGRRLAPLQTAPQVAQALLGDLKADLQIGSRGLQLCQPLQVGSRFVGKLHGATGLRLELSQGVLGVDLARPGLGEKAPAARARREPADARTSCF